MDAVTIANLALAHIGDQSIVSFDDPSQEARFCKLFYDQVRQEVLRYHPWNFAIVTQELTRYATAPIADWNYAYQLPVDLLRLLQVNSFAVTQPPENYEIQGLQLLSDNESIDIRYVQDVIDASLFDSDFVQVLTLRLAAKLSKPLAGSMDIAARLNQEYKYVMAEARRVDGSETKPRSKPAWVLSPLVAARLS